MKITLTDFLLLVIIAAGAYFYILKPQSVNTDPAPVIYQQAQQTPAVVVIEPSAPPAVIVVTATAPAATWTPFYVMPTITPLPTMTPIVGHSLGGGLASPAP
jgi:hypothetical protein